MKVIIYPCATKPLLHGPHSLNSGEYYITQRALRRPDGYRIQSDQPLVYGELYIHTQMSTIAVTRQTTYSGIHVHCTYLSRQNGSGRHANDLRNGQSRRDVAMVTTSPGAHATRAPLHKDDADGRMKCLSKIFAPLPLTLPAPRRPTATCHPQLVPVAPPDSDNG